MIAYSGMPSAEGKELACIRHLLCTNPGYMGLECKLLKAWGPCLISLYILNAQHCAWLLVRKSGITVKIVTIHL